MSQANSQLPTLMTPSTLVRGQVEDLTPLLTTREKMRPAILQAIITIILGAGLYGFTVGLWRGLEMAFFVAIKTPLLLFITLLTTGLLNGMLGLVLGTGIGFRQSLLCQLLAFSLASIFLASLAPVTFFLALEAPSSDSTVAAHTHAGYLLTHTAIIGIGGLLAVTRLFGLLCELSPSLYSARITLLSWIASNAFVGAQISFLLRPFFGSPTLPIEFLREHPFDGTFYESVWRSLAKVASPAGAIGILLITFYFMVLTFQKILKQNTAKHLKK